MKRRNVFIFIICFVSLNIFAQINTNILSQNITDDELNKIMNEFVTYCPNHNIGILWENLEILLILKYPGSEIPPAQMFFLSNSIMFLKWEYSNEIIRFFKYSINNNEISIEFIDPRLNWVSSERERLNDQNYNRNNRYIISVNENSNTVVYNYTLNGFVYGIMFGNFFFLKK